MKKLRSAGLLVVLGALVLVFGAPIPVPSHAAPSPQNAAPSASALKDALFVVTHVDLIPEALAADKSALQQYVADSRKDAGALRVELLQQADRGNHFTIVSVWASEKDFNAHLAAAHTRDFRAKIQAGLGSPFDERLHRLVP